MTGHRTRLSVCLALFSLLTLALPAVGGAADVQAAQAPLPAAQAQHTMFLPLVGKQFDAVPAAPTVRFWAERYTLDEGACTPIHWKVTGTAAVSYNGANVASQGVSQACPSGSSQLFTLEVQGATGDQARYDLVLSAGDPALMPAQVIAQATVQAVTAVADVDPLTPGNQGGYELQLKSVVRLYAADTTWNQPAVTLRVPQSLIDYGFNGVVHWPVKVGQQVEFRASCDAEACSLPETEPSYLYLRSE